MNIESFDITERIERAVGFFESGFNCAQSVFLAYHDLLGLDADTAKKMSVSFGGGMGRMREVCGTMSAMAMLAGFKYPMLNGGDQQARKLNYAIVQQMAELFKAKHGTIICDALLKQSKLGINPIPAKLYTSRPCGRFVVDAAEIAGRMLKGELELAL